MDELLGLIISTVISFGISMIVWKFIYHKKLAEYEENKIDNYKQAIDKLVDLLSHTQAFSLRMVLLHAYSPYCSIEDLYTRVSSEADCSGVLEDQLKLQLRELFNSPALFLRDKEMFEKCAETWFPDDSKKEVNKK